MSVEETAPGKANLVLHLGPVREDGLHEICSLFASLELADRVSFEPSGSGADEVVCPGVEGPNLVERALAAYRERRPELPPLRVEIDKRIPVAAGLAGGSADAAAALRAANAMAGDPLTPAELLELALDLGSDLPSQVEPRHWLVSGTGGTLEPVDLHPMWLVLLRSPLGLPTGQVFAEADRLGTPRGEVDPQGLRRLATAPLEELAAGMENDLEAAADSLRPELPALRAALVDAGALAARVTGSGPTVFGVFGDREAAAGAAAELPGSIVTGLRG